jgi:hypothetical protein
MMTRLASIDREVELNEIPDGVDLNNNQLLFWALVWEADATHEHDWVLVGMDGRLLIRTYSISWHNHVARREGIRRWPANSEEPQLQNAVEKLIILE